jgi:hypothetical protein
MGTEDDVGGGKEGAELERLDVLQRLCSKSFLHALYNDLDSTKQNNTQGESS